MDRFFRYLFWKKGNTKKLSNESFYGVTFSLNENKQNNVGVGAYDDPKKKQISQNNILTHNVNQKQHPA